MATDNLNYYSSWLPAWQLTDKYSSQPWCLKSKNLDIFSSSKSVKATAWSNATTTGNDIVKQDGKLILKTDWKVYERENWTDTLFIDPSTNFPSYSVCYTWIDGTYAAATFWTVQDMVAKYEWDERKSFVVLTDRASFVYSKQKFIFNKKFDSADTLIYDTDSPYTEWYLFKKKNNSSAVTSNINIRVDNSPFWNVPIRVFAVEYDSDASNISLDSVTVRQPNKFYYDKKLDWIAPDGNSSLSIEVTWSITNDSGIMLNIPTTPNTSWYTQVTLTFRRTPKNSSYYWNNGELYIDVNGWPEASHMMKKTDGTKSDWDTNYYYSYLPLRERKLVDIGAYGYSSSYWMKWIGFQPLYKRASSWLEVGDNNNKIIYDFVIDMWWESDTAMDVIWMIVRNEQVYMIWNLDWNWYIIPCDLTWWRWTPYIAYGCEFTWAANIDYLLYLVWEDRGVSTLWVFNQQELVPIIWGRLEQQYNDRIWVDEQFRFDWKIINRRKNLILTTTDNRIFQYGQTYGGKWWSFIHELQYPITDIKVMWNDLVASYKAPALRPVDTYSGETPYWDATFQVYVYSNAVTPYSYNNVGHNTTAWAILNNINSHTGGHFTWLSLSENWNKLASDYPLAWTDESPVIVYVVSDTIDADYSIKYQDDTPIKNYNTEWQAVYPIVLWNHILEKEESDLYASYILPASSCKLEFWGMANHYHFWTFTSEDNVTLSTATNYKLKWSSGAYNLEFLERNWNQYTFRLEGDLPVQTTNEMKIIDGDNTDVITYSDFNHFRKIWVIETDKYCEWEFRFHNLNNKLELPKSHSLQIMVKGKGTANYTPELFSVDLVANQRERW